MLNNLCPHIGMSFDQIEFLRGQLRRFSEDLVFDPDLSHIVKNGGNL